MKTCKYCNKEFDEELTFCPFCGKENTDKKLTYIEKKQAREKDTEIILSRASIQQSDLVNVKMADISTIYAEKDGDIKKLKIASIIRMIVSIVVMIGCIIWAQLTLKGEIGDNIKLVIVIAAYFVVAVAATILISDIYIYRAYMALEKNDLALRKISFVKGPMFLLNGVVYEIKTNETCKLCDGEMHVEDKDDEIYLVCSKNRAHLYKVDKLAFMESFKVKIEQLN